MKRYVGLLSEIKDLTHRNQTDVDAYMKIAKKYQGKILELGSGSGNISVRLANEGYDVTCLEIQRDMVYLHEEKLDSTTEDHTTIVLADMCSFELDEKFDLIIAAQNVVNSLKTPDDMLQMLSSVKKHLSEVGVFVIECDYPNIEKMKKLHDVERVDFMKNPRSKMDVENKVTSVFNLSEMIRQDRIIVTEFKNDRIKRRIQVIQDYKIWSKQELKSFFRKASFHLMLESGSLGNIEPIAETSSHMIFFLKV